MGLKPRATIAANLKSIDRIERMKRWVCGVSLKDRKYSEDLCNFLGIRCVADVVRYCILRWSGHLERKNGDDWVSSCRYMEVAG